MCFADQLLAKHATGCLCLQNKRGGRGRGRGHHNGQRQQSQGGIADDGYVNSTSPVEANNEVTLQLHGEAADTASAQMRIAELLNPCCAIHVLLLQLLHQRPGVIWQHLGLSLLP